MRKVFLLSLLLVVLSLVIPWLVVTLGPAQEPAVQPIPSVTASAAVAPDSETASTALSGGVRGVQHGNGVSAGAGCAVALAEERAARSPAPRSAGGYLR